jgi:hypothetical protein
MRYEFSFMAMFIGLAIMLVGVIFIRWYKQIADFLGSGAGSYTRYRFWALMFSLAGIFIALNLHSLILTGILSLFIRN